MSTRWIAVGALPLLLSCSIAYDADDFSVCGEQCDDPFGTWPYDGVCAPTTLDRVRACDGDFVCVELAFTLEPADRMRACRQCVYNQYITCGRGGGCRCEWEEYNCCRVAAACAPDTMECGPCDAEGARLLFGCLPDAATPCAAALDVCSL